MLITHRKYDKKQNKIKILYKIVFITNDVCAFANEGAMNQTHWGWTHSVKVSVEPPLDKVKVDCNLRGWGSVMCFPYNIRANAKIHRVHVNPGCVCGGLPGFQSLQAWRDGLFRSSWLARLAILARSEFYWETLPQRVEWKSNETWFPKSNSGLHKHMCT